jgi:trehalose-6-phosphate hydrolase
LFWNNHDQPWALNRFGDTGKYREKSAEMLATATHCMRGTPYIYMGEEIGMMDPHYSSIHDYVDVEAKNAFAALKQKGISDDEAFAIVKTKARDNSRVPMHWDDSKFAGFSESKPWLLPTDQDRINVEKELHEGEIFAYYQKLIKLRKHEQLISDGHIRMFLKDDPQIFAYERFLKDEAKKILVFTNFYGTNHVALLPEQYQNKNYQLVLSNYSAQDGKLGENISLKPYEALVIKIN